MSFVLAPEQMSTPMECYTPSEYIEASETPDHQSEKASTTNKQHLIPGLPTKHTSVSRNGGNARNTGSGKESACQAHSQKKKSERNKNEVSLDLLTLALEDLKKVERSYDRWIERKHEVAKQRRQQLKDEEDAKQRRIQEQEEVKRKRTEEAVKRWHEEIKRREQKSKADDEMTKQTPRNDSNQESKRATVFNAWKLKKAMERQSLESEQVMQSSLKNQEVLEKRRKGEEAFKQWMKSKSVERRDREQEQHLIREMRRRHASVKEDGHLEFIESSEEEVVVSRPAWQGPLDRESEVEPRNPFWFGEDILENILLPNERTKKNTKNEPKEVLDSPPSMFSEYERYERLVPDFVRKYPLLVARAGPDVKAQLEMEKESKRIAKSEKMKKLSGKRSKTDGKEVKRKQ